MAKKELDWGALPFAYVKTDYRYVSRWRDGGWDEGGLVTDHRVSIEEGATALHYGQQCFEGLKAFSRADGSIQLFRPDRNAARMAATARRLIMPEVPEEKFIEACLEVVRANADWVPPHGSGASFYLRPYLIGVGDNLGVRPAPEYRFSVFGCPVGPYFKGGFRPFNFVTSSYDRAAPRGTGAVKVGGNYAASLLPHEEARHQGFADCVYLDPSTHTKIEEAGAANFFAVTRGGEVVTPLSPSILPSITKYSLLEVARERLGLRTVERDILVDRLDELAEAGACGTAAVITPIGGISHGGRLHVFHSETEVGPVTRRLYETLVGIQNGDLEAPSGWIRLAR